MARSCEYPGNKGTHDAEFAVRIVHREVSTKIYTCGRHLPRAVRDARKSREVYGFDNVFAYIGVRVLASYDH